MIERITICGIPCSGTKLLNHMFASCLPGWDYNPIERGWSWQLDRKKVITKFPRNLFQLDNIKRHPQIAPIITVRDPWFVLTSKQRTPTYWSSAERIGNNQAAPLKWLKEIIRRRDQGMFIVHYEELIKTPCEIQQRAQAWWDLPFEGCFSEFTRLPLPKGTEHLNVVRPLSTARLTLTPEDKTYLREQVKVCPALEQVRKELGYASISLS